MESIKLAVNGNYISIIQKPKRITAGTVGLPVEFEFDRAWDGLSKTAVFHVGCKQMMADIIDNTAIVPWEILQHPNLRLNIGVYGASVDGAVAIVSTWSTVGEIHHGANPHNDPLANPAIPIWQKILHAIGVMPGLKTETKNNLVGAINEVYDTANSKAPASWGLMDSASGFPLEELDSMITNGWFYTSSANGYYIGNEAFYFIQLKVDSWYKTPGTNYVVQTINNGGCEVRRELAGGTWQPWEWINPPMKADVEYRTTERFNGQPVYTKMFSTGDLTNGESYTYSNEPITVIRSSAAMAGAVLPHYASGVPGGTWGVWYDLTNTEFVALMGSDRTSAAFVVQVWYLKE